MRDKKKDEFFSYDLPEEEEAEKLNMEFDLSAPEEEEPGKRYLPFKIGAAAVIIIFLLFSLSSIFTYLTWPSLSFLHESRELEKDPYFKEMQKAVVQITAIKERVPVTVQGSGTGFNLSSEGVILTNRHVVEGAQDIVVNFENEGRHQVKEWYFPVDETVDMAILILEGENLPFVNIDENAAPETGSEIIIVGNPLGFPGVISEGSIKYRINGYDVDIPQITIEAPIHPGSSGSPVFNKERQVIGIVYATLARENESDPLGLALSLENIEEVSFNGSIGERSLSSFLLQKESEAGKM